MRRLLPLLGLLLAGASVLLARPIVGRRAAWLTGAITRSDAPAAAVAATGLPVQMDSCGVAYLIGKVCLGLRSDYLAIATLAAYAHEPIISLIRRCHEALRGTRGVVMSIASLNTHDRTMVWLGVGNVEGVLLRHPKVLRAAVVEDFDAGGLPCACAFVVAQEVESDASNLEQELREAAAAALPRFKQPRRYRLQNKKEHEHERHNGMIGNLVLRRQSS